MKASVLPSYLLALAVCFGQSFCSAQEAVTSVATISQVLPFASQGTLAIAEKAAVEPTATSSGVATPNPANVTFVQAGASISTGQGGASSLILGTTGAARMKAETEVKIPDASEKSHSLELLKGQLFLNISGEDLKKRNAGEFKLKTPAALLAVKGTKFFSRSVDGKDTIGVHEGSVEVVESTTGQKLTLAANQAVEVSPGVLGSMREMSDEEKESAPEYDWAKIARMTCGIYGDDSQRYFYEGLLVDVNSLPRHLVLKQGVLVPTPHMPPMLVNDFRPWLNWKEARGQTQEGSLFAPKPQITDQGTVRYAWKARVMRGSEKPEPARLWCMSYLGSERNGNKVVLHAWQRIVAVEFQLRTIRVDSLDMKFSRNGYSFGVKTTGRDVMTGAQLPSNGSWVSVTLPVRDLNPDNRYGWNPGISLVVMPSPLKALSQEATAVEMRNFVLLFQP